MALITKIRKHFWFVLILLGLALAAFILMDVQGSQNLGAVAGETTLGTVNGQKIDYRDYQMTEGAYYRNSQADAFTKRSSIWNYFVEKTIIENEANDLGLSISTDELKDLQFGANVSPIIQQNWANPQTRQLDVNQLQQIKTAIENGDDMNPDLRAYWAEQENQIIKDQLQKKLTNLVSKSLYTPTWMAESSFKDDNTKADFKYVKIPFTALNQTVTVTDADYQNYINENKYLYTEDEETRSIQYAGFVVTPTSADSTQIFDSMSQLKTSFAEAKNDSLFTLSNGGSYPNIYFKKENLPEPFKARVAGLNIGDIVGPYADQGAYSIVKTLDIRNIPDSVSAKHILRNADASNTLATAQAEKYVDSLMVRLNSGAESWDSLAIKNSQDPSNAFKGGDLGTFTQGRMVGPFNDVCFLTGKKGGVYKVKTQYGIHIVKIEDQIYTDSDPEYKLALIQKPIVPSESTQNAMYDKVSDIVAENRDYASLKAALTASNIQLTTSPTFKINDSNLGTLGSNQTSRDIIKWAFDPSTEVGDVSPEVYAYSDPVNYFDSQYVIACLGSLYPKGLQPVSAVKSKIHDAVLNKKKGEAAAASMNFSSLDDLASQYGAQVQTATAVTLANPSVPGLGNEREVIGTAFKTDVNSTSKPIVGNGGVYVVQPTSVTEAGEFVNIPSIRKSLNSASQSSTGFSLMESLKKSAKIEDNRATFF